MIAASIPVISLPNFNLNTGYHIYLFYKINSLFLLSVTLKFYSKVISECYLFSVIALPLSYSLHNKGERDGIRTRGPYHKLCLVAVSILVVIIIVLFPF